MEIGEFEMDRVCCCNEYIMLEEFKRSYTLFISTLHLNTHRICQNWNFRVVDKLRSLR